MERMPSLLIVRMWVLSFNSKFLHSPCPYCDVQMFDMTCLTMNDPPANKTWDCKDIDNYHCGSLDQVFQVGKTCRDGIYLVDHYVFSVRMVCVLT